MLLVQSFGSCGQLWLCCRQRLALAYLCLSSSVRSKRYTASLSLVAIVATLILAQPRRPATSNVTNSLCVASAKSRRYKVKAFAFTFCLRNSKPAISLLSKNFSGVLVIRLLRHPVIRTCPVEQDGGFPRRVNQPLTRIRLKCCFKSRRPCIGCSVRFHQPICVAHLP